MPSHEHLPVEPKPTSVWSGSARQYTGDPLAPLEHGADFKDLTKAALIRANEERGLPTDGTREQLVRRLVTWQIERHLDDDEAEDGELQS